MHPGEIINKRYRLIDSLGLGRLSIVFLAEDMLTGAKMALKVAQNSMVNSELLDLFKNEFKILLEFEHPNLVKVYEFDSIEKTGGFFFTSEYIDGINLEEAEFKSYDEIYELRELLKEVSE